ncbi:MAG: sugar phosphate isomerase/epimerase [Planctomycetota bacterium]|nr:sugar phosphate isomerase/epimerase [Planctomycetota bacterium]
MYSTLCCGAIRVKLPTLEAQLAGAKKHGFRGLQVDAGPLAERIERDGLESVRGLFEAAGVRAAGFGLPVDWRGTEEAWRQGLERLPRLARAMAALGVKRTFTHLWPSSDELNFDANWRFHVERFTPIAKILAEHGAALGLEFLGPKTLRDSKRYPFVYTLGGMLELGRAIGPNVGLLLDCWHWHTGGGTVAELRALRPEQVVFVHVNDAPAGIPVDEVQDTTRALPGETGVIDIVGFLRALKEIGYDGPVTPEPFKKELKDLPDDDARLAAVGASMNAIFSRAF